jgi:hypothetical protein
VLRDGLEGNNLTLPDTRGTTMATLGKLENLEVGLYDVHAQVVVQSFSDRDRQGNRGAGEWLCRFLWTNTYDGYNGRGACDYYHPHVWGDADVNVHNIVQIRSTSDVRHLGCSSDHGTNNVADLQPGEADMIARPPSY